MFAGQSAELVYADPETSKQPATCEADRRRSRPILLYAAPGCGAESFMRGLAHLKRFTLVRGTHFPIDEATWTIKCFGNPPLKPGLHFLGDYDAVLKAVRRLMDSIIDMDSEETGSMNASRVIYSASNISHITALRQLYPDALHVHFARDVSRNTLRMADEADLPAWSFCKAWRQSERAFMNSPPLPTHITIRYEELEHAPAETFGLFMRIAGLPLTAADQDTFAQQFSSTSAGTYVSRRRRPTFRNEWLSSGERIRGRIAGRCAAVYCQAELAALRYNRSIGRPGLLHTFAAVAGLRLISRVDTGRRRRGAGNVYP
jgi:hypothetical protein